MEDCGRQRRHWSESREILPLCGYRITGAKGVAEGLLIAIEEKFFGPTASHGSLEESPEDAWKGKVEPDHASCSWPDDGLGSVVVAGYDPVRSLSFRANFRKELFIWRLGPIWLPKQLIQLDLFAAGLFGPASGESGFAGATGSDDDGTLETWIHVAKKKPACAGFFFVELCL